MTDKSVSFKPDWLANPHIGQVRIQAWRLWKHWTQAWIKISFLLCLCCSPSRPDVWCIHLFVIALVDCGINRHNHIINRAQWKRQLAQFPSPRTCWLKLCTYRSWRGLVYHGRSWRARCTLLWFKCAESCATQWRGVGLAVIVQLPHGHSLKAFMSMCSLLQDHHLGEVVRLSRMQCPDRHHKGLKMHF